MGKGYEILNSNDVGSSNNNPEVFDRVNIPDTKIADGKSLYQALEEKGLLLRPRFPAELGWHLIPEGSIGLFDFNGKPRFGSPGRYTFWHPLRWVTATNVSITDPVITNGPVTIVTVRDDQLGLSTYNNSVVVLPPGRHILQSPHKFESLACANEQYVNLGNYHRILVQPGYVAMARKKNEWIVIDPKKQGGNIFETLDPTFRFEPETGFKSVKTETPELPELQVFLQGTAFKIKVQGLLNYRIEDPLKAFTQIDNVHEALIEQAKVTLTAILQNLTLDQVAPQLPASEEGSHDAKGKGIDNGLGDPFDGLRDAKASVTELVHTAFLNKFRDKAQSYGVDLMDLQIERMDYDEQVLIELRNRMQQRLETETAASLQTARIQTQLNTAEAEKRQLEINTEAEAARRRTMAELTVYEAKQADEAARILANNPLAAQLRLMEAQKEIVAATGDKAVFYPSKMVLSGMYGDAGNPQMMFGPHQSALQQLPAPVIAHNLPGLGLNPQEGGN